MSPSTPEYQRAWRKQHPEKTREYARLGARRRRAKYGAAVNLAGKYRLSTEQAMFALALRPDTCECCGDGGPLVYDHNHATGEFRGWICARCNHGLGHFRDDPFRLEAAIRYLRRQNAA